MGAHGKLEIVDWRDLPCPSIGETQSASRFWPPAIIGISGTLLLHALVLQAVHFGSDADNLPRLPVPALSSQQGVAAEDANNLVLISLQPGGTAIRDTIQNVVSFTRLLNKISLPTALVPDVPPLLPIDSLTLGDAPTFDSTPVGDGGGTRARLVGIYTGQIQARIDRVWRRPRTPVDDSENDALGAVAAQSFQCEAQIVQDPSGYVQEILLPRCNGSPAWQHSLVTAIQQASPLPAPPDPTVFSRSITLSFVGLPYTQGAVEEDYEVAPARMIN